MSFFKSAVAKHQEQLDEEFLYGYVADEIANNHISPGLWTKALVATVGDEQKARIQYIKYRFEMLKTEGEAIGEVVKKLKNAGLEIPKAEPSSFWNEDDWNYVSVTEHRPDCGGKIVHEEKRGATRYKCHRCGMKRPH